ncbi:MAG: SWIM zinc finger family protein [Ilumatobacteraceae bacterium]
MSEPASWTIEQVVAIAPTPSRFAAAEGLAVPARWAALGADGRSAWGRCRGTGREPYDTMVDHATVAWRCSCPSRSHPCKHALALLIMWVRGHVPIATAPAGVSSWVDGHTPREPAAPPDGGSAAGVAAPDEPAEVDDAQVDGAPDLERARDERVERLRSGLVELDRWLDDRLRTGLADPALARYATWDDLAARLVDARAGALANRVRRLAGVVGARPDWHEVVLAELGVMHLLAQAGQRVPELPGALADAVATSCGWQVRQADVLAGVPDTDTWVVAGRSDTREDRIEVRRTWLRGRVSGRWAMILSFAAYRQSLDDSLPVGTAVTADLHRYPGPSSRALVGTVHDDGSSAGVQAPPGGTVAEACAAVGSVLAAEPWVDRVPATVLATPASADGRWVLTDHTGALALVSDAPGLAALLAASAGRPVAVTVEWTVDGAVPLTVHLPDRALDIGPRADTSFVSAA